MIEKASLNNLVNYFGDGRKIGNWTVVGESSLSSEGFFRSGVTMENVSGDGNVSVERERLTILQMVGEIEEDMSLSRLAGIRLKSQ